MVVSRSSREVPRPSWSTWQFFETSDQRLTCIGMLALQRLEKLGSSLVREVRIVLDRFDELEDLHVRSLEFLPLELVLVDLNCCLETC